MDLFTAPMSESAPVHGEYTHFPQERAQECDL